MAIPSKPLRWATAPGPGQPGSIEPTEAKKDAGWLNGEEPPAGWFNWYQKHAGTWIDWLYDGFADVSEKLGAGTPVLGDAYGGPSYLSLLLAGRMSIANLTAVDFGEASLTLRCGARAPYNGYLMLAGDGNSFALQPWGNDWFPTLGPPPFVGTYWCATASGSAGATVGLVVFAGSAGEIKKVDPTDFESIEHADAAAGYTGNFRGAAYSPLHDRFVLVGDGEMIQTAPAAATPWTQQTPPAAHPECDYWGVVWSATLSKFIAVGSGGTPSAPRVHTSPDGIVWTACTLPAEALTGSGAMVAEQDGKVLVYVSIADGASKYMLLSDDAVTWEMVDFTDLAYGQHRVLHAQAGVWYFIAALAAAPGLVCFVSVDRRHWAPCALGSSIDWIGNDVHAAVPVGPPNDLMAPQRFLLAGVPDAVYLTQGF